MSAKPRHLTERKLDVLRGLLAGMRDRDIAENLGVSINTVKRHNQAIFIYLGITGRRQLFPLIAAYVAAGNQKKKAVGA